MAKQHAPRFIIEVQSLITNKWNRSGNPGLTKAFFDKAAAEEAIRPERGLTSLSFKYRVRSK